MKFCLLVVDVQNGFITEDTEHLLPKLLDLCSLSNFDCLVFSKFKNIVGGPYQSILKWHKLTSIEETEIHSSLKPYATLVFEKNIYTCVSDSFIDYLKINMIDTVFIAGIDTDCCVLTTAVDLFQNNFVPFVLADYCASTGGIISHSSAITVLKRLIGENQIIKGLMTNELLEKMRKPS
jgi:nicotinamidase-related amidase